MPADHDHAMAKLRSVLETMDDVHDVHIVIEGKGVVVVQFEFPNHREPLLRARLQRLPLGITEIEMRCMRKEELLSSALSLLLAEKKKKAPLALLLWAEKEAPCDVLMVGGEPVQSHRSILDDMRARERAILWIARREQQEVAREDRVRYARPTRERIGRRSRARRPIAVTYSAQHRQSIGKTQSKRYRRRHPHNSH